MSDFIVTRDRNLSAVAAKLVNSVRVCVNKSLQVDHISSKSGKGINFNDSLVIPALTFPSGGVFTMGPSSVFTLGSGSVINLGANSSLCVDVIKSSSDGPIQINDSVCITGSLTIDRISPKTGSVLSVGGSLCVEAGRSILVDRIVSKSGGPIQIDASLVLDPEVIFVNNIFPSLGSLVSINSSVCVAASANLAVDTIVSKTGNLPVTIDDSLCVNGTILTDSIAGKTGPITFDSSLCINGSLAVDVIKSKTAGPVTIDDSLCVNGSLIVSFIRGKPGTLTLTVDDHLLVTDSLSVDVISPVTGSLVTVDASLCVNGNITGDHLITDLTNTILGQNPGLSVTGSGNTVIGVNAGNAVTTEDDVTAIGFHTLRANVASNNTGLGAKALENNTSGTSNTAIGASAGHGITTTSFNVCVGDSTLAAVTTGARNTALGSTAMASMASGSDNTVCGTGAMFTATTGEFNTVVGTSAMSVAPGSADRNVVVGGSALRSVTGDGNTVLGTFAGSGLSPSTGTAIGAGSNNILIGRNADVDSAGRNGCIILDSNEGSYLPTGDNQFLLSLGNGNRVITSLNIEAGAPSASTDGLVVTINGVNYIIPLVFVS